MTEAKNIDLQQYIVSPLYPTSIPTKNDLVIITFKKIIPDQHVIVTLNEYDDMEGTIYLSELTNKKRIRSLAKLCPIGQTSVAEVVHSEPGIITLSKKYVTDDEKKNYNNFYGLSKRLQVLLKKFAYRNKIPLKEICETLSWPLYNNLSTLDTVEDKIAQHPCNLLSDLTYFDNLTLSIPWNTLFHNEHSKLFGTKTVEKTYLLQLLSYRMNGVQDLKNLFKEFKLLGQEKFHDTQLNISIDECPKYNLKFKGTDEEEIINYSQECFKLADEFKKFGQVFYKPLNSPSIKHRAMTF